MKKEITVLLMVLALSVSAADLVTKSGKRYAGYKIKEVDQNSVTIVFLTPDGSPDSARIAVTDLPDDIAGALGLASPPVTATTTATQTTQTTQTTPADAAVPAVQPASPAAGFEAELYDLANAIKTELAGLNSNDKLTRSALLSEAQRQAKELLRRYSEVANFRFVSNDSNGVLAQVVGTGQNALLKSGDFVYISGGLPPANRQFQCRIFPGGVSSRYGSRDNVRFYGANEQYALEIMLAALGRYAGDPLFFQPESEELSMVIDNTTVSNIDVYAQERYTLWDSACCYYSPAVAVRPPRPGERGHAPRHLPPGSAPKGASRKLNLKGKMAIPAKQVMPRSIRSGIRK